MKHREILNLFVKGSTNMKKILSFSLTLCMLLTIFIVAPSIAENSGITADADSVGPGNTARHCIDPGHGGSDPGAVSGSRREATDNLNLSIRIAQCLEKGGQTVNLTRNTDVFHSITTKYQRANGVSGRQGAFVSVHRNSASSVATGIETLYKNNGSRSSTNYALALRINNKMVAAGGWTNRGVKVFNNLGVLNGREGYYSAGSCLIEAGFVNNSADNSRFDNNFHALAHGVAEGMMNGSINCGTTNTHFTVTYNANGGTGAPAAHNTASTASSPKAITLSGTRPTRASTATTSYTFASWNTNSAGTGTNYNPSQAISISANMTLYARWTSAAIPQGPGDFTISRDPFAVDYNQALNVTWTASANATSYDYTIVRYAGEVGYTNTTTIMSGNTTARNLTVPGQTTGKYIQIRVTAKNAQGSKAATNNNLNVACGPWSAVPNNVQRVAIKDLNGGVSVAGHSTIWTKDKGAAFAALYWAAVLLEPQADGKYRVAQCVPSGTARNITVSGNNLLLAVHGEHPDYATAIKFTVGTMVDFKGLYFINNGNTLRGAMYVTNNVPTTVVAPTITSVNSVNHGTSVAVSWGAVANAIDYTYEVKNGTQTILGPTTVVSTLNFNIPAQTAGTSLTVTVTARGPSNSAAGTKTISLVSTVIPNAPNVTVPPAIVPGQTYTISWPAVTNAVNYAYKVDVVKNGVTTPLVGLTTITATSFTLPAVSDGTSVIITVTANGATNNLTTTKTVNITPLDINSNKPFVRKGGVNFECFTGFMQGDKVSAVKNSFKEDDASLRVRCALTGNIKDNDAPVATGDKIILVVGGEEKVDYKLVVLGDVDGDGKIGSSDCVAIRAHLKKTITLTGENALAAQVTQEGGTSIASGDYILLKAILKNTAKITLEWKAQ